MKVCLRGLVFAVVVALTASLGVSEARAADGCAEKIIRARVSELGEYEVWSVKEAAPGVLLALKKDGEQGVIMVGLASVAPDLVTYQSAWGRAGKSELNATESAWLKRLFDKLYPDASFRACPEISRETAPTSEQTFAALQEWWKALNKVAAGGDASKLWLNVLFGAVAVLFAGVVVLVFIIRKRRLSARARMASGGAAARIEPLQPEEPRAETPGEEPVQSEEPEEVL